MIAANHTTTLPAEWRDFIALTKPRVMTLVVFTGACGLLAAPGSLHPVLAFTAVLCIALGAGAAGALNQWYEADLDAKMKRTAKRPLPAGRMDRDSALFFGVALAVFSVLLMGLATNWLAAGVLIASILYYVIIYTMWLKPRTPQNIVIGGAAGAFPAVIGWAAVTGDIGVLPMLLFALVFAWTPPHFWALSLFVRSDYAKAGVPMLPVTHGFRATRHQLFIYTIVMAAVAVAPWPLGETGAIYGITATALSLVFIALAWPVLRNTAEDPAAMKPEKSLFKFSVLYLFVLFGALVVDRMLLA